MLAQSHGAPGDCTGRYSSRVEGEIIGTSWSKCGNNDKVTSITQFLCCFFKLITFCIK